MKKLLFMMMIASNLNAMQVQIMPAISKVSREDERKSRVCKFVIEVHRIHNLAISMKSARVREECNYEELHAQAKRLLAEINDLNGNLDENRRSFTFRSDTVYLLAALLENMNKTSEPLIRRWLDEIEETRLIVWKLISIRAQSHVCSTSASGSN